MPKIKNWSKEQERGTSYFGKDVPAIWVNTVGDDITNLKLGTKRVEVTRNTPKGRNVVFKKSDFDKQEKARKYAVNWMRNHPRG